MTVLGWLRRLVGGSAQGARTGAPVATVQVTRSPQASIALGEAALGEGRFAEAIAAFEAALDAAPDAATHRLLARARAASGDEEGAIDELELALHLRPEDVEARIELAERLLAAGRREEALQLCERGTQGASDVELHLRFASCLKALDRLPQAIAQYESALRLRPGEAAILNSLGLAQANSGNFTAAEASYTSALRIDPNCVEALHNLGMLRREQGAVDAARELFERALALRPESIETQSVLAHALRDLGRFDEALTWYRRVLERRPETADAVLNFSFTLLMSGRLAEGWDAYERRLELAERPVKVPLTARRWSGEPNVAVHVLGEQGLGDQIMFASCLPDLLRQASRVSLVCAPRLERLFQRSFRTIELRPAEAGIAPEARWVALGSLPRYYRRDAGDFPVAGGYLRADGEAVARWREQLAALGPGLRVGLSWRGGTLRTRAHLRSIPAEFLTALAPVPEVNWISLQYGPAEEDVARLGESLRLRHWPVVATDLDECAALIEALDLIVTIDTTVAHLAGALGRPVWILLSHTPEWRFGLSGTRLAWYPSARLWRQAKAGDWAGVIDAVRKALPAERARGAQQA